MKNKILEYSKKFFYKIEIDIESLKVIEENELFYYIKLNSSDGALLIGQHGQTIESLQRILAMTISNLFGDDIRIKLEINDYHKTYEDKLFARIDRSVTSLLNNGGEYELGILSPYDRKRIHSYIAKNYENIISKSKGEGDKRKMYLYINKDFNNKKINNNNYKKPEKKLSIDIDGDGI